MSTPYEAVGRSAQKSRTRDALVSAARDLVASGATPTVEEAAAAASISRTTAYRYFPNKRALLLAAHPEVAATSMLPTDPPSDVRARLDAVVRNFSAMILDTEAQQRTMLRLSLEADSAQRGALPLRQGRAIGWIAEALDGLVEDLSRDQLHQLVLGIRATIGIEAIVWLVDVAGLTRKDAVALTRWSAQALLEQAMTVPPPTPTLSVVGIRPVEYLGEEQQATLKKLGASLHPLRSGDLGPIAGLAAAHAEVVSQSATVPGLAKRLGVDPSRVRQRIYARSLYAFKHRGTWLIPNFQLEADRLVPGVEAVVPELSPRLHPVAVSRWFTTPHTDLVIDDRSVSPITWLSTGGLPDRAAAVAGSIDEL